MRQRCFLPCAAVLFLIAALGPDRVRSEDSGAFVKANLDLPFDARADGEEEEPAPEIVVFYGQQYEGDGFFFCCDKSLSMRGAALKRLQQEVIKSIEQLSDGVQFGIVFFDSSIYKYPEAGMPATTSPSSKNAMAGWVLSVPIGAASCYKEALLTTLQFSQQSTALRKTIIVLGDGVPWCPGYDREVYATETLETVRKMNIQRAKINTICLGGLTTSNETWMRTLATMNNGTFSRIVE